MFTPQVVAVPLGLGAGHGFVGDRLWLVTNRVGYFDDSRVRELGFRDWESDLRFMI
jgi:hypothetical protein